MMRALAEFIMRGRLQAGSVAVLGYIIPLLTPVTLALVTLRKGAYEGTVILLLALVPALLSIVLSEGDSVVLWGTLLTLVAVYIPALILRLSISLPMAVLASIMTAFVITGIIIMVAPGAIDSIVAGFQSQLKIAAGDQPAEMDASLGAMISSTGILGMIAYALASNALVGVLLGRWLQALVFNPGGFRKEFCELRLGLMASVVCFLGSVLLRYQGDAYFWWSNVMAIPLLLVAISIAHTVARQKQIAKPWLVLFYFAAFIFVSVIIDWVFRCLGQFS